MPDHYKTMPSTKKTFPEPKRNHEQYEKPIGPVKPTTKERLQEVFNHVTGNPELKKVVGKIQDRGREINEEREPLPHDRKRAPQRFSSSMGLGPQTMSMGMPSGDLFGVGNYGGFMIDHMRPPARQNDAPKRRKKKRKTASAPAPRRNVPRMAPTGIPSHMKWMFGR